ncbi:hypothetical protein P175DRAFT_0434107 [Aspergillus ochraceoroseus IBT 24754]|uniref:Thioredoxin domain-containing protein n=3 Tax=Aspergillus subgen. Nidulantes TaxID=2720870 RepID=A0A0F8X5F5_9EURO|nr:uncharacterized protein P175DRAFT_0434107 [Aspergillus ochraceoroseus IBT 24754]KKK24885.1 hypothetical protein ARAM_000119 [Aspergillus rambellii]KKK26109.1 hypothetical protein AOCH_003445 [Aspergillus ochraceoroseus]PTU21954.1 hypothetical protein P175DRAFT_0434107 [Aspergillus ochraceoroseus IBT 24754]
MPIITDFKLPSSADTLDISVFFISFHASPDPNTRKPWCPDVAAALPYLQEAFSAPNAPQVAFVDVGQRDEWREPFNVYRTKWNVSNLPTLVRYEQVDGKTTEVGRLVEGEILDKVRLQKFVSSRPAQI